MTNIAELERNLTQAIAGAADERALEELRVAALGKKGSVAELLKTLGAMSPEERKINGPLFNGLRDSITSAIAARRKQLGDAALDARLQSERVDVTLPAPEIPPPWAGSVQRPRLTFLLVIRHYQGRPGVSRSTAATRPLPPQLAEYRDVSRFARYGATFALTEPSCPKT